MCMPHMGYGLLANCQQRYVAAFFAHTLAWIGVECLGSFLVPNAGNLAYSQLVDAIYETALNPNSYLDFARIWDHKIVEPIMADGALSSSNVVDVEELKQHFERALKIFEKTKLPRKFYAQKFLDDQKFAAAITRLDGSLLASNPAFESRFGLARGESLYKHTEELVPSLRRNKATGSALWQSPTDTTIAARYFLPNERECIVIVEKLDGHGFVDIEFDSILLVKSCHAEWTNSGANILAKSFGLTSAEMEIARELYEGQRSNEIASSRGRAIGTVQKQIKSLLNKAQVNSQSEFISLVIGLMHVVDVTPEFDIRTSEENLQGESFKNVALKKMGRGRLLQFAHYGHMTGDPVLFLHSHTSSAIPTDPLVQAATAERLQIIAPCKPGVGQSSPAGNEFEPMAYIEECLRLLDSLGIDRIPIAGHAMSGVYAIEAAARYPERFSAVGLFDTGIPMTQDKQFQEMSEQSRRIFLTAKKTPELLYAPFAFAADAGTKSEEGKDIFVRAQFGESEYYTTLLAQPHIYSAARHAMLNFMRTPHRSVDEIIYWASDWTEAFRKTVSKMPVIFVQSELHKWLAYQRVVDFSKTEPAAYCTILSGTGELFIYDRPDVFYRSLRKLCDHAKGR